MMVLKRINPRYKVKPLELTCKKDNTETNTKKYTNKRQANKFYERFLVGKSKVGRKDSGRID